MMSAIPKSCCNLAFVAKTCSEGMVGSPITIHSSIPILYLSIFPSVRRQTSISQSLIHPKERKIVFRNDLVPGEFHRAVSRCVRHLLPKVIISKEKRDSVRED